VATELAIANLPPSSIGIQQLPPRRATTESRSSTRNELAAQLTSEMVPSSLSAIAVVDALTTNIDRSVECHPRVAYEALQKQHERFFVHRTVFRVAVGLVALTALGVGLGMGLRNKANNDKIEEIISAKDEEIEEVMVQAALTKKEEQFMYLMTLFAPPETNDTKRCRNGYAPSCGDCWCSADDDWNGEEDFICPQYPTGWIDSCTPLEQRLKVSSHFKRYVKRAEDSSSDEVHNLMNEDSLPIISYKNSKTESPLMIPTSDGTTTFCNPFGESKNVAPNPFVDLPPCFTAISNDQNIDQPVCVFKQTSVGNNGNVTEVIYEPQTLALNEALAENTEIVHSGSCGMCSTAQDVVALVENIDSWYATSNACVIASVVGSGTNVTGDTSLFKEYYSCYHDVLGNSAACSMALATLVLGTSLFCDWQGSIFDTIFKTGDSRFWYGGPPPTCSKSLANNGCSIPGEQFGLPALGIFYQASQQSTILLDDSFKCSRYLEVANISEYFILNPSDVLFE